MSATDNLNRRQLAILDLLQASPSRDLYETGLPPTCREGSGFYAVTSTPAVAYEYINTDEVNQLVRRGLIVQRWPGCYMLAGQKRFDKKGKEIPLPTPSGGEGG